MALPVLLAAFVFLSGDEAVETRPPPAPEMNIRHRFGERTLLKVVLAESADVPYARLALGFSPWAAGADGVGCDVPESLAAAKEGAACDTRLLDRMREVQRAALGEKDPERRLAGRKLGTFLANLEPEMQKLGDPDLLHLEALSRLRAAEETLGLEPTPLAPYVRDSVAGTLPWQAARAKAKGAVRKWTRKTQRAPTPEMEKWAKAELAVNEPIAFAPDLAVTWYNAHLLRFYVSGLDCAGDGPGGSVTIRLWVPDGEEWLVYEVTHSFACERAARASAAGLAPDPCAALYEHALRYPDEGAPAAAGTVWKATRLWGRAYPFPRSAGGVLNREGRRFEWTFVPGDFFDQRPLMKAGFRDSWFAEVVRTEADGKVQSGRVRILWPAGSRDGELAAGDSLPFATYQTKVRPLYESLRRRWEWGDDERFYRDFARVVLDADEKLLEKTYTNCGSLPPIMREVPAVRLRFYREIPRIVFISERLDTLRKAYLADLLEGREPTPPKAPEAEPRETPGPDADAGESLELDEEAF